MELDGQRRGRLLGDDERHNGKENAESGKQAIDVTNNLRVAKVSLAEKRTRLASAFEVVVLENAEDVWNTIRC